MTQLTDAEAALKDARALGIHRIWVPTPFMAVGVNLYLLDGSPRTLIDTGPNWATAWDGLESALAAAGFALTDIELILLTHQHMDHVGLAGLTAERSGAEVAALDLTADYVADYAISSGADDDLREQTMREHGIDAELAAALHASSTVTHRFGGSVAVDRRLVEGDRIEVGDHTLATFHRPGHSPSDTIWVDEERRIVFAGDHLLSGISSNALVDRPLQPGWSGERAKTLLAYRDSLALTRTLDADVVLSGHGDPITDHRALIDDRLRRQEDRAETLLGLLGPEPKTARRLALELFKGAARTQVFLALSEVLGHLDLLVAAGQAREVPAGDGLVAFVTTEGA